MGWSSRLFLLTADDELQRLAGAAFSRMLRPGSGCRLPQFAGQRVRLASVTVELADGIPLGVRHLSFSMLDFDGYGVLDVQRLNAQQVARVDTLLAGVLGPASQDAQIVEAASRFVARGGEWNPDPALRRRIEAAALGAVPCRRVRVSD
jgi:hypothetical protein